MHIMLYHCYTVLQINDAEAREIDLKRFVGLAIAWFLYGVCPPVYLAITVFTFSLCTPTSVARLKSTAWKTWQNAFSVGSMKNRFFVRDWFEFLPSQIICSLNPLRKLVEISSIFGCSLFFKLIISTQFRRCQWCQAQIMIIGRPELQNYRVVLAFKTRT